MTDAVDEADRRLGEAVEALRGLDPDELPGDISADVKRAYLELLSAKGRCEAREVSAE
jgi:hypothetical protein